MNIQDAVTKTLAPHIALQLGNHKTLDLQQKTRKAAGKSRDPIRTL